jgi:hypothetical protein
VSRDKGRNWRDVQAVAPEAGKFQFQAPSDGEYWFSVRTLDNRNKLHPEGPVEAGLQVIVDTTRPTLQLGLRSPAPGKVSLSWSASAPPTNTSTWRNCGWSTWHREPATGR